MILRRLYYALLDLVVCPTRDAGSVWVSQVGSGGVVSLLLYERATALSLSTGVLLCKRTLALPSSAVQVVPPYKMGTKTYQPAYRDTWLYASAQQTRASNAPLVPG